MKSETPQPSAAKSATDDAIERKLLELAFGFHVGIEGEYGCPGATCPGVQRLVEKFRALKGVGMGPLSTMPKAEPVQPSAAPALDVEPEPLPGEGHEHWRDMAADQVNHFWFTNRESGVLLAEVDRLRGRVNDLVARLRALQETEK